MVNMIEKKFNMLGIFFKRYKNCNFIILMFSRWLGSKHSDDNVNEIGNITILVNLNEIISKL